MITKQTAYDIWNTYEELENAEKLLAKLQDQRTFSHATLTLSNSGGLSDSFRLAPKIAEEFFAAHVAGKKAELGVLMARARVELFEGLPPPFPCPNAHA